MSLGTPWMLLLLPVVALAGWLMLRARRLQHEAACRLQGVAPENRPAGLVRRDTLVLAALTCTIFALARPQWNPRPYNVQRRGRDLVVALDVSRSMLAADVFPSRLEAARIAIHEALPVLTGQRIALITFAGSASVRVPLTLDHGFVRYMLERADASDEDVGSTSLQAAFEMAADKVLTDAAGGRRDLVVFTDGEDHLSNIEKTAELLAECDARVLIIGLGDPIQGARVPRASDTDQWMRYKDAEVVSRLEEGTLAKLAEKSPHVTYYPARTRPFELLPLYQEMISGAADDVVVGELRQVRYTEGYPFLLGLSVVLWLVSSPWRLPAAHNLVLLALLLLPGCARRMEEGGEAAFQAKFQRGNELLQYATGQPEADAVAQRSILLDAREEFLCAALLRRGDLKTARRITAITRRLTELEVLIERQRVEEEKRNEEFSKIIERLQKAAVRDQQRLSQQSQQLLRRYPAPPQSQEVLLRYPAPIRRELKRLAAPASLEQRAVRQETVSVCDVITSQRDTLRELLTRAYGNIGRQPATELDPVADLLTEVLAAQQQALVNLKPQSVHWPRANTAFHTATGRMQQSLETLRSLQPPSPNEKDNAPPSKNEGGYDETMEALDSDAQGNKTQPVSVGDFKEALSLRSLPVPNYTSADILAEESANQQKRARQKAARAGAKVEKNW